MKFFNKNLSILTILFILSACDFPWDPGPQPIYIEKKDYQNQLNVLGIMRPGNNLGVPLSFVHLETTYDYFDFPDSTNIVDADVQLFEYDGMNVIDTINLMYTNYEGIFSKKEYRSLELDSTNGLLAGKTFSISCKKTGYPELTSQTTIPQVPVIVGDSINVHSNLIEFNIEKDDLSKVYDVYLITNDKQIYKRFVRSDNNNTHIEIDFTNSVYSSGKIVIYAYDLKLSEYITSNVIIKPQTYQNSYSTVENGYGCFGSINILEKNLTF